MSSVEDPKNPEFDINAEARAHGEYLNLPQSDGETDERYRSRIAGVLRAQGRIIEAHEVSSGRRYDDPEQGITGPMTGIIGALAQELNGRTYSPHDPERQVGDDIAAGVIAREGNRGADAIAVVFDMFGPGAGMDILDAFRDPSPSEPQE